MIIDKRCNDCGQFISKDMWKYYTEKEVKNGYHALCKKCLSEYDYPEY